MRCSRTRELGLTHRDQAAAHPGPVDVARGQPPRLQERRHEQHTVITAAGRLPAHRIQGRHLRHHVPAQGRVAPADQLQARTAPPGHRHKAPSGQDIDLGRGQLLQAAGVGQDEAGRSKASQRGAVRLLLQDGHHLNAAHRLRPGRVIVEHAQQAVRGPHRADGGPQALVVGPGFRKPSQHLGCGGQAVAQSMPPFCRCREVRPPYSMAHGQTGRVGARQAVEPDGAVEVEKGETWPRAKDGGPAGSSCLPGDNLNTHFRAGPQLE